VHEIYVCRYCTVHADNLFDVAVKLQYRFYAAGIVVSCLALFDSRCVAERGLSDGRCARHTPTFLGGC
jgi:hypothetical protein